MQMAASLLDLEEATPLEVNRGWKESNETFRSLIN